MASSSSSLDSENLEEIASRLHSKKKAKQKQEQKKTQKQRQIQQQPKKNVKTMRVSHLRIVEDMVFGLTM